MLREFAQLIGQWGTFDTWIVITAALAAMACALPGNYLLLRRQSLMGDALSHAVLPGIAGAFLAVHAARQAGWLTAADYGTWWHAAMFTGAIAIGMLTALLAETVQKLGGVESSAALGVVFTGMFAVGLILIRVAADRIHLDADCVLYGTIETVVMDTVAQTGIPRAAVVNGAMLGVNLLLAGLFWKELRIAAFDPALATTQGISAGAMHYGLMAITAATLVAAFESVGSILVVAMLIVPAATAHLLTDSLSRMVGLSLLIAAASAALGHLAAITVPGIVFPRLGFTTVTDASTAGMMAVAAGGLFIGAVLFGHEYGLVSRLLRRTALRLRVAAEDILGAMFRHEEDGGGARPLSLGELPPRRGWSRWLQRLALSRLARKQMVAFEGGGYRLTDAGRIAAQDLVRSHRLWESYLEKHLGLSAARLHKSAHRMEHFIGPELREELASELDRPAIDPHGRTIPPPAN
ncbi:MAG: metal ABC transporter permease [Pirellulales bacterium]|nr:metal ABC transporter permease [Pirellulales bacterium]